MALQIRIRPAASIKCKVNPALPVSITGSNGLTVTQTGGSFVVKPAYDNQSAIPSLSAADRDNTFALTYNSDTLAYTRLGMDVLLTSISAGLDATLVSIAGLTPTTDQGIYFSATDTAAVYSLTASGRALAGTTGAADKVPYFTGPGSATTTDLTAFGRSLIDDADAAAARTTIGAVIGTDVQAFDADLAALAANSTDGFWAHTGAGTGAARTLSAPAAGITISNPAGIAGDPAFALANDLAAVEGLSSTGIARRTGTDTWSVGTAVSNSELATMAAYTLKGNSTGSSATPTDIDIAALTTKGSPAAGDYLLLSDQSASGALKKATVSTVASAGSVVSIAGNTGAFTLSNGITNSTNDIRIDPTFLRNYIAGLILSKSAATTVGIAAGVAVDSTQASIMKLSSAYTKTFSAWAVGSGNGGLDTGAIANNTGYHVWLIQRSDTGVVDVLLSTSASSPTMPTNYDRKRRIGWVKTDATPAIRAFNQYAGGKFIWATPIADAAGTTISTTSISLNLSTPGGVVCEPILSYWVLRSGATAYAFVRSPNATDVAPSTAGADTFTNLSQVSSALSVQIANPRNLVTGTSSEIYFRADAGSTSLYVATFGWIDPRGIDD